MWKSVLKCQVVLFSNSLELGHVVAGGEEQSQLVGGDVTSVDLDQLDPGAQYEVQVMALVRNREGNPVSVRITTRESYLSYRYRLTIQNTYPGNKILKAWVRPAEMDEL